MARIVKNKEKWHRLTINGDRGGDVVLVSAGRRSYLSCRGNPVISGRMTLRRLAEEILRAVPKELRRAGRK
jgi:hypothetical protein